MIKTFRGLLVDGGQHRIRLSTKKGKVGYRIIKFQIITKEPTTASAESIVKIFKIKQTSITDDIDFSDGNMLAVGMWTTNSGAAGDPEDMTVIFDKEIFNQDVYITHVESTGTQPCNYYVELETQVLSDNAASVSTLRDIRLTENTV